MGTTSQAADLVVSPNGTTDIFAAGTVPVPGGSPAANANGAPQFTPPYAARAAAGTTVVTTTDPALLNPCDGGAYRYSYGQQNGKPVYDVVCE